MNAFDQLLTAAEIVLQLILLILLVRGPFRKYLAFSLYTLAGLILELAEIVAYYRLGWHSLAYFRQYWTDQILLGLLLFAVVITCTYEALGDRKLRKTAGKALGAIMAFAVILPFALLPFHHSNRGHGHFTSLWFYHTCQILNFGAAIMNVVLWVALLSNRKRDPKLVTVSVGLGIFTTCAAIAWGVRLFLSQSNRWPVDTFVNVAHIASLLLWCWIFKPKREPSKTKPLPPAEPPPNALTTPS